MKKQVLYRFAVLLGLISMICLQEVFSHVIKDKFVVKGRIVDSKGEKAVGATVVIKGTNTGTVTDVNGIFSINLPSSKAVLLIRHFSTTQIWEDSFEAGKEYVIKLAPA